MEEESEAIIYKILIKLCKSVYNEISIVLQGNE